MRGVDLPCEQLVEWVTEYLEGTLPADSRSVVEEHLSICDGCRAYLAQFQATLDALGGVSEEALSPAAWSALRGAFHSL